MITPVQSILLSFTAAAVIVLLYGLKKALIIEKKILALEEKLINMEEKVLKIEEKIEKAIEHLEDIKKAKD